MIYPGTENVRRADAIRAVVVEGAAARRHCRVALAAMRRCFSELLQIYGVDPLMVAAQTGTSVAMIEKAYLRFIPSAMQEKLAALKG
jgi:hypothetical protein